MKIEFEANATWKFIATLVIAFVLGWFVAGSMKAKPDLCRNGKPHGWGNWTNAFPYPDGSPRVSDFGYIYQRRYCTNCGMVPMPREAAFGKLRALAAGTVIVRREIAA